MRGLLREGMTESVPVEGVADGYPEHVVSGRFAARFCDVSTEWK